jgi:hypothetical protein
MVMDQEKKELILRLLRDLAGKRAWPKTICPSEVARALSREELEQLGVQNWRDVMNDVREVVWELRGGGEVEVLQKGVVLGDNVKLGDVRGPIRIRTRQGGRR